jgi:glycosyltransferase involved in cell wall biosynthesis
MGALDWILFGAGTFWAAIWWLSYGLCAVANRNVPRLSERRDGDPAAWPSVSVIVPACNEAANIEVSLRSLLDQDYPKERLQLVVIDDRSTDDTGTIISRLSAVDDRILTARVEVLPDGWLGKVNALQRGLEAASGELLLFCDADIDHGPGLLRRAVALFEAEELDLLTLFPRLRAQGVMRILMTAFADGYLQRTVGASEVVVAQGRYFGLGAFMLLRRRALDNTAGLRWLKLDVLDDLALAKLMNDAGARCGFAVADDMLSVEWYPTLRDFVANTEKNFWGGMAGFSSGRCLALAILAALMFTGPFVALLSGHPLSLVIVGTAFVPVVLNALIAMRLEGRSLVAGLLNPLGQLILAFIMARAAIVGIGRNEITWRGTRYSVDELREGRRVTYP